MKRFKKVNWLHAPDWREIGNEIYALIDEILCKNRGSYGQKAAARGISLEQLAAAAITARVRARFGRAYDRN